MAYNIGMPAIELDPRWFLSAAFIAAGLVAWAAVMVDRRLRAPGLLPAAIEAEDLARLAEAAPAGLLIVDAQGKVAYANPRACQIFATDLVPEDGDGEAGSGDRFEPIFHAMPAPGDIANTGQLQETSLPDGRRLRLWLQPLGAHWLIGMELAGQGGQGRQARPARRVISDLAHELRTPLATILTHLEVQKGAELPEDIRRESMRMIQDEAEGMSRLVHDMLELSRWEAAAEIERRPVDLLEIVRELIAQYELEAREAEMAFFLEASQDLHPVLGQADALRRVCINLIENGLNYGAGKLSIKLQMLEAEREDEMARTMLRWTVEDEGPGVAPEHLDKLVGRFYRAPQAERKAGSGLGLALVEEIVRQHEGRLRFESPLEEGVGLRVIVDLPAAEIT